MKKDYVIYQVGPMLEEADVYGLIQRNDSRLLCYIFGFGFNIQGDFEINFVLLVQQERQANFVLF